MCTMVCLHAIFLGVVVSPCKSQIIVDVDELSYCKNIESLDTNQSGVVLAHNATTLATTIDAIDQGAELKRVAAEAVEALSSKEQEVSAAQALLAEETNLHSIEFIANKEELTQRQNALAQCTLLRAGAEVTRACGEYKELVDELTTQMMDKEVEFFDVEIELNNQIGLLLEERDELQQILAEARVSLAAAGIVLNDTANDTHVVLSDMYAIQRSERNTV